MSVRIAVLQHEPETTLGAFARMLDEADVDYEVIAVGAKLPEAHDFDGALALGGSLNTYDPRLLDTRRWIRDSVLRGMPFLGVCLGGQLLASALGARVARGSCRELGVHDIFLTDAAREDPLFAGLPRRIGVFGWHEDSFEVPPGATSLARSIECSYQAFRFDVAAYGLQFHPEVRTDNLRRWRDVPGYKSLVERGGGDWHAVAADLESATPELDALARQLLGRWLSLVSDTVAAGERWMRAAA